MRKGSEFVLFASDHAWRIAQATAAGMEFSEVEFPAEADVKARATIVENHLRQKGYGGEGVLLVVPSSWCLSAQVSTESLPRQKRFETLVYRLEEKLPLAAESFVADFVTHTHGATGVCVRLDLIAPMVNELEASGVVVEWISPAAFLALQELALKNVDIVLWEDAEGLELLGMDHGAPVDWYKVSPSDLSPPLVLAEDKFKRSLEVAGYGVSEEVRCLLKESRFVHRMTIHEPSLEETAAAAGVEVLRGHLRPWVNFRRDALSPPDPLRSIKGPLIACAAAVIFFFLCLSAMMLLRAHRYHTQIGQLNRKQEAVFRQALPAQAVPLNIRSRLVSEAQRLSDLHGGSSDKTATPSALILLKDVLASVPPDLRFRINELQVTPDHLLAEGQARAHSDAERLAKSFDQIRRWSIESPRTQQTSGGGIGFTINGAATGAPSGRITP